MATVLRLNFAELTTDSPTENLSEIQDDDFVVYRRKPITNPSHIQQLKCKRFKYQPSVRNLRPVSFEPLTSLQQSPAKLQYYIDHPTFIAKYQKVKNLRNRRRKTRSAYLKPQPHLSTTPPSAKPLGYKAPLPTSPFEEDVENDAFEFFPEWQHPLSALRSDLSLYQTQLFQAEQAEARKPLERGSPLNRAELILKSLRLCHWECLRTPSRPHKHPRPHLPPTPSSFSFGPTSPMDLDP